MTDDWLIEAARAGLKPSPDDGPVTQTSPHPRYDAATEFYQRAVYTPQSPYTAQDIMDMYAKYTRDLKGATDA